MLKRLAARLLVLGSVLLVLFVAAWVLGTWSGGGVAHAYVAPRPTVELVKVFACDPVESLDWKPAHCAKTLEDAANQWLQEMQPGIHIIQRSVAANKRAVFLTIFYEVPEWRTKLPAEAPPK